MLMIIKGNAYDLILKYDTVQEATDTMEDDTKLHGDYDNDNDLCNAKDTNDANDDNDVINLRARPITFRTNEFLTKIIAK